MSTDVLYIMVIALAVVSIASCLVAFALWRKSRHESPTGDTPALLARSQADAVAAAQRVASEQGQRQAAELSAMLERQLSAGRELQRTEAAQTAEAVARLTDQMAQLRAETARSLEASRVQTAQDLERVRLDNAKSAEAMRTTVGERLDATLGERLTQSFAQVDARLQQVNRGLGEMQGLASGVGDLKRVLSNVKTRGIVGEVQLGAILREVLAPAQYAENVATVPGRSERVEFAVRIPGEDGTEAWLPIDAKFPGDTYDRLRRAQEAGDAAAVEDAWRALETRLRTEAKDIHDKYLAPPATTTFGVLFLPFEGLYAEVADRPGLLERLQRESRVTVAGPSTMAALLSSLEMGFQAVAIQRRADEIQRVLVEVRTEFGKYRSELERAQRQLATASRTVDALVTTRTRAMERKLAGVTELDEDAAAGGSVATAAGPAADRSTVPALGRGAATPTGSAAAGDGDSPAAGRSASPSIGAHFKQGE